MVRFLAVLSALFLLMTAAGIGGIFYGFWHFGRGLPDYRALADYEPPVMTRVHAGDGRLLVEYAVEQRVFVPIRAIPDRVINAFLSAEDKNFYEHYGVDPVGVIRAVVINLKNLGANRRPVGASTITQQVAKNFLLTNEVSIERKAKEAILAIRIERALSKERILELYLNEIYLGLGSYGVAAAALNYFEKPLADLSIADAAYLAALPKAPNNYHPVRQEKAAIARRDWVIQRMLEDGHITREEAEEAWAQPLGARTGGSAEFAKADYFAEEVRRELAQRYGENQLYKGGLSVRTTLDPELQEVARRIMRDGLEAYDRRHGWRGAEGGIEVGEDWQAKLAAAPTPPGMRPEWTQVVVLAVDAKQATIGLPGGTKGTIPLAEMKWARPWLKDQLLGDVVRKPADVVKVGDLVLAEPMAETGGKDSKPYPPNTYGLRQMPKVDGGLVAIDPHTGRVLAMVGGYSYDRSQFNRVTQAARQPGSAFKPFVYLAALEAGYTPTTMILDAPFVIDQGPGLPKWRPANYTDKFYGPSTLRLGVEKSRNLMTVRLAQTIGMDKVAETAERFGVVDNLPETLSMALGSVETTLLRITNGYAQLVNGGKKITPTLIDRIQDRQGKTVLKHDMRACDGCNADFWTNQPVPEVPDTREQLADPASVYQMVSILQGVVERGTGIRIRAVGRPLAGKTGTTNDSQDAWFVGFSPDLAVGVFVGFDEPKTLGKRETGSSVAVPIFRDFMAEALADQPTVPFRIPPGIRLVRVDPATGEVAQPGDSKVIWEAFKDGTVPSGPSDVLTGYGESPEAGRPTTGTGGLY